MAELEAERAETQVVVHHLGGARYLGENARGDRTVIDASPDLALGMKPMETLLASLAACSAIDVVSIMEKRKTPLRAYRIELSGRRASEHPKRFEEIVVHHIASGEGVTEDQLERAAQLSGEKYCSVAASLNARLIIQVTVDR
jgi:putative redox protein